MLDNWVANLIVIGAALVGLGGVMWYGGNKVPGLWTGFGGAVVILGGLTLLIQESVQHTVSENAKREEPRARINIVSFDMDAPDIANPNYRPSYELPVLAPANNIFNIVLRNFGPTVATEFEIVINSGFVPMHQPIPAEFDFHTLPPAVTWAVPTRAVIPPDQTYNPRLEITRKTMEILNGAYTGLITTFLYGTFKYKDVNDRRWEGQFCYAFVPVEKGPNRFIQCDRHNGEREITESPVTQ